MDLVTAAETRQGGERNKLLSRGRQNLDAYEIAGDIVVEDDAGLVFVASATASPSRKITDKVSVFES